MSDKASNHFVIVKQLLVVVVGMFCFGFVLVPIYDVFCDITGLNGKTRDKASHYQQVEVDQSRWVTVQFVARTHQQMPWDFSSESRQVKVRPGALTVVNFNALNRSGKFMVGQAVPSVTPGSAAVYLNKTECFCFNQQPLEAGENLIMPMQFYIDPKIPKHISHFTVQYTLYDMTEKLQQTAASWTDVSDGWRL